MIVSGDLCSSPLASHLHLQTMLRLFAVIRVLPVFTVMAIFFVPQSSSQSYSPTQRSLTERTTRKWADEQANRNPQAVKAFFKKLETKNRQTLPGFAIRPASLSLLEAAKCGIPESIQSNYLLASLSEYRVDNGSLILAKYELNDEDEPLNERFTVFAKIGQKCKPLVFPYEVASIEVAKSKEMRVFLRVIEGGHGSGTLAHIYKIGSNGALEQLMELGMWQDSMVEFVDIDGDGNAEIMHVTLEDLADNRFYLAEIYKWTGPSINRNRTNGFQRIGVKYYWDFPAFMNDGFSLKEGWDRCDILSTKWIVTKNRSMPANIENYFLEIEAWTKTPYSSAILSGLQIDVKEAKKLGIAETEFYRTWPGDKRTQLKLAELRKIAVDQRIFAVASYEGKPDILKKVIYVPGGKQFKELNLDSRYNRFWDNIKLVKLGKDIPLLIDSGTSGSWGDVVIHVTDSDYSLKQKLKIHLYHGQYWYWDVDGDGIREIVVFNDEEAPAGIGRILLENGLGAYVLYVPRVTIYKWKNNEFIKLAVKYYSEHENLPNGLIREALVKIAEEKQH